MLILFSADGKDLSANISKRFGHAKYYLIIDTDNNNMQINNNFGHDDEHSSLINFVNNGVKHFVVGNIGPHAFSVLKERNAKIFLARKQTVGKAYEKFINNELPELDKPTLKRSIEGH